MICFVEESLSNPRNVDLIYSTQCSYENIVIYHQFIINFDHHCNNGGATFANPSVENWKKFQVMLQVYEKWFVLSGKSQQFRAQLEMEIEVALRAALILKL